MEISHVIRGEDHISNTPRQVLLFEALGFNPPIFAHLPMILGADKSKLSKRHGATNVTDYREQGYLSQALFNFMTLLFTFILFASWYPAWKISIFNKKVF